MTFTAPIFTARKQAGTASRRASAVTAMIALVLCAGLVCLGLGVGRPAEAAPTSAASRAAATTAATTVTTAATVATTAPAAAPAGGPQPELAPGQGEIAPVAATTGSAGTRTELIRWAPLVVGALGIVFMLVVGSARRRRLSAER